MRGIIIKKSDDLKVLCMKSHCDIRWNRHIFSVLVSASTNSKSSDLFTIYTTYIRKQMEYNSHVEGCVSKSILRTTKLLVNDSRAFNCIYSLKHHCNVDCVPLFYRYSNRSSEISVLIPQNNKFLRNTRLSRRAHPYIFGQLVDLSFSFRSLFGLFQCATSFVQGL